MKIALLIANSKYDKVRAGGKPGYTDVPQALKDIKVMSKLCHDLNFDKVIESVDHGFSDAKKALELVKDEIKKADSCKDGSTKLFVLVYYAGHGSIK